MRSDSQQKHLVDLPENFAGCNPANIPAAWVEDRALVFDPTLPDNHPDRTFGPDFAASPGAHAEMMRKWLLEDTTPYIDETAIAYPADWPDWERRDEIAATPVIDDGKSTGDGSTGDFDGLPPATWEVPKKAETADDKVPTAIREFSDPAGIDIVHVWKDQIAALNGLKENTLNNALTRLTKASLIHRQVDERGEVVRGVYALRPTPADTLVDEDAASHPDSRRPATPCPAASPTSPAARAPAEAGATEWQYAPPAPTTHQSARTAGSTAPAPPPTQTRPTNSPESSSPKSDCPPPTPTSDQLLLDHPLTDHQLTTDTTTPQARRPPALGSREATAACEAGTSSCVSKNRRGEERRSSAAARLVLLVRVLAARLRVGEAVAAAPIRRELVTAAGRQG
ncbi:hypothetical protein ACFVVP_33215 [Streptomyces sp. NPDC058128]|uniref:hypothetical protein n=1 Tax=Streptomyces sp. NPDC058128 TaxID=3346352 RepID=UPI0036E633FD